MEDFKKFTLLKETPTITSDGTKVIVKPPVMIYEHKSKPEESQDELYYEALTYYSDFGEEAFRKRFKIERI